MRTVQEPTFQARVSQLWQTAVYEVHALNQRSASPHFRGARKVTLDSLIQQHGDIEYANGHFLIGPTMEGRQFLNTGQDSLIDLNTGKVFGVRPEIWSRSIPAEESAEVVGARQCVVICHKGSKFL